MEGRFKIEMKNLESDAEPINVTKETFLQVILFLFLFVSFFARKRELMKLLLVNLISEWVFLQNIFMKITSISAKLLP